MFRFDDFKNRKLNEESEETIDQMFQEIDVELDENMEDKIILSDEHSLVLYSDNGSPLDKWKEAKWFVALRRDSTDDHLTFVKERQKGGVEVLEYDIYIEEDLTEEEKRMLEEFGIEIGKVYPNMIKFWKHCKELEKKMKKDVEI